MNRTEHIGYLTRNVEMRKDKNGNDIAKFSIAINRKSKDGDTLEPYYFDVVAFGAKAMACYKYLERGMRVGVSGHLRSGSYISRKTGQKMKSVDIVAEDVEFLSHKKDGQEQDEPESDDMEKHVLQKDMEEYMDYDEELPFDKNAEDEDNE